MFAVAAVAAAVAAVAAVAVAVAVAVAAVAAAAAVGVVVVVVVLVLVLVLVLVVLVLVVVAVVVLVLVLVVVVVEPLNDAMTFSINRVQKRPIRRPPLSFQGTKVLIPSLADGSQLLQHLKTRKQTVTEHAMDAFISKRFLFAVKIQQNGRCHA